MSYDEPPILDRPEQTEQDIREIERRYDEPPDEPHPRYEEDDEEEDDGYSMAPVVKPDVDGYSGFDRG